VLGTRGCASPQPQRRPRGCWQLLPSPLHFQQLEPRRARLLPVSRLEILKVRGSDPRAVASQLKIGIESPEELAQI